MFEYVKNAAPGRCPVRWCRNPSRKDRRLCHKHHAQKYRANNPIKAAYKILRDNAKRRRKVFTLTLEEFTSFCMATTYLDEKGCERHCLTIDRIDPSKGYTFDNIQPLTCSENTIKGNKERCPF
jgi:hypothetical protein